MIKASILQELSNVSVRKLCILLSQEKENQKCFIEAYDVPKINNA
jgi:hypothetical protein